MSLPGPIAIAEQNAIGQVLTASGQTVYIINITYSGTPSASNYMELPTVTTSSGAYQAQITSPRTADMIAEPGRYLQSDRFFHIASGAVVQQWDQVQVAGTGDFYVVSEIVGWDVQGGQVRQRLLGRRIKVN